MDKKKTAAIEQGYQKAQGLLREQKLIAAAREFANLMPALREADDLLGQSRVLTHLAQIFVLLEDLDQAREFYGEARRLAIEAGDQQLQAISSHQLACLTRDEDPAYAKELLHESRGACIVLGDVRGETVSAALIGQIDFSQGDHGAGMRTMLQALGQMPEIPERDELVEQIRALGSEIHPEVFEAWVCDHVAAGKLRQRLLHPVGS